MGNSDLVLDRVSDTMREQIESRHEAMIEMIESHGWTLQNGEKMMSFWQLAHDLNNCWYAHLFVKDKRATRSHDDGERWAIQSYMLFWFRAPIKRACEYHDHLDYREQSPNKEYIFLTPGYERLERQSLTG